MKRDTSKLPKWAQEYIRILEAKAESDIEHYRQKMAELSGDAATNTFIDQGYNEVDIPLEKDARIKILLGGDRDYLTIHHNDRGGIVVRKNLHTMSISPEASNSVIIR
jgi:hypothetical protein